jgi:hypothetical protein
LAHLGVPFDLEPPNYDNPELSAAIRNEDWDSYRQQVAAMNDRYPVWGTKIMANATTTAHALSMIRNPILLCVFRDPCAVATRKQMVGKANYSEVAAGVKASLKQYVRLVDMLETSAPYPMMYVSYGNAVEYVNAFVHAVNAFIAYPISEELSPEAAREIAAKVLAEGVEYRRAKTRKAIRQAKRQGVGNDEPRLTREDRRMARREQALREKKKLRQLRRQQEKTLDTVRVAADPEHHKHAAQDERADNSAGGARAGK